MPVSQGPLPQPQPAPARPWVILLVDDEPDILASVKAVVEMTIPGTQVIPCANGRSALDLLGKERIDLIISDFKMPGMDGIEFLYQCRRAQPFIPRLMLTAFADDDLMRRAITEAFVDAFIPKMASPGDLLDRIKQFLVYHPQGVGPPGPGPSGPARSPLPRSGAP